MEIKHESGPPLGGAYRTTFFWIELPSKRKLYFDFRTSYGEDSQPYTEKDFAKHKADIRSMLRELFDTATKESFDDKFADKFVGKHITDSTCKHEWIYDAEAEGIYCDRCDAFESDYSLTT